MEITRLAKKNHYEEITEQLQRLILDGSLKVGDKLPSTKELSERFGVGRSTTREALSALKAMGLIEIRQGGGCTVISSSPLEVELPELRTLRLNRSTVLELIEARQTLEVSNAALAAEKGSDEDIHALNDIVKRMEQSIGDDQVGEQTDVQFHRALAQATHNSILVRMFDSISEQMELAIQETRRVEIYANRAVAEQLYREHLAIFHAVQERRPEDAALAMKSHLQHVEGILMKYL
ncbi:GntR family transcriptional regulator [Paenibacillus selenitireducens]|uniref:GntR family transcriptional regulator n=1 Tax=Paenibacillus selenitireducens TaxID=1324314 RepID=A0A1T2XKU2_9BACL|nr:FadR/GntR family transcriptional regulator [Paenibacillus selenitireducens]OPA80491.1 GntR family transcriptional regulator [Paenibacillus selenitireducens]